MWSGRKNDKLKLIELVGNLDYKQFTERRRPHIHPPDSTLFLTFRLAGSIPQAVLRQYQAKRQWLDDQLRRARADERQAEAYRTQLEQVEKFTREWFIKFENILDQAKSGPVWLKDPRVAAKVADNLHRLDNEAYRLDAHCVMSNHVHAVFKPFLSERELREAIDEEGHLVFVSNHPSLSRIMQSLKGRSARECNLILSRRGQLWEQESFDHVIRPGKFSATIRYVLNNPVKARLVKHWQDWQWSYCRNELLNIMSDKL